MKNTFYDHGYDFDQKRTDTLFVSRHPQRCAKHRKPTQYAVIFLLKHIKYTNSAGYPENQIFHRDQKQIMPYQPAHYDKPVIHKSDKNSH